MPPPKRRKRPHGSSGALVDRSKQGNNPLFDGAQAPPLDDRAWFSRNPRRAHRLRRAFPGERVQGEQMPWIAVCGRGPGGALLRAGLDPGGEPLDDGEALARAVFGAILDAIVEDRTEIDPALVAERARGVARRGG